MPRDMMPRSSNSSSRTAWTARSSFAARLGADGWLPPAAGQLRLAEEPHQKPRALIDLSGIEALRRGELAGGGVKSAR